MQNKKKIPKLALVHAQAEPEHHPAHEHAMSAEQAAALSLLYRASLENRDLREAYKKLLEQTTQALMKCLEERDAYTYGHSMRVMEYASMIAKAAGLPGNDVHNVELAAMFHDLGKIGVADCVLLKPERLDSDEGRQIREHPVKSAGIVHLIDAFHEVVGGVLHHHERFDGRGYPNRLSGEKIPLYSRVILVADTFDAMTSSRPYRRALPIEEAYAEIQRFSGTQFDPEFARIFLQEHQRLFQKAQQVTKIAVPIDLKKSRKKAA